MVILVVDLVINSVVILTVSNRDEIRVRHSRTRVTEAIRSCRGVRARGVRLLLSIIPVLSRVHVSSGSAQARSVAFLFR